MMFESRIRSVVENSNVISAFRIRPRGRARPRGERNGEQGKCPPISEGE